MTNTTLTAIDELINRFERDKSVPIAQREVLYSGLDFAKVCKMKHGCYFERYWGHLKHTLPQNKICGEYLGCVDVDKQLVSIAVPKTATSSLRNSYIKIMSDTDLQRNQQYLNNNLKYLKQINLDYYWNPKAWPQNTSMGPTHIPLLNILEMYPNIKDYFIFCFVRNPYSRLVSAWVYINDCGSGCDALDILNYHYGLKKYNNKFDDFIKNYDFENNTLIHLMPQYQFLLDDNGEISKDINFIGKYENLAADSKTLCKMLNIEYKPPQEVNRTQTSKFDGTQYIDWYNDETKKIVADVYKKDFEYFGYKCE